MQIPVLVQNAQTKEYLREDGHWTTRDGPAVIFSCAQTAIEFCLQKDMKNVQLIYRFEKLNQEVPVPLSLDALPSRQPRSRWKISD